LERGHENKIPFLFSRKRGRESATRGVVEDVENIATSI
jgi:hypothetical protein